ncbi:ornithine cyclodeaminase [Rhizobiales bacterium GAS191]|nr:ornithine cyclodeaminase [Rhizobiales bacterium GAS188]SEC91918.1 ornithine cyclodeaminase [Rhizobiales bacterium GAS191]
MSRQEHPHSRVEQHPHMILLQDDAFGKWLDWPSLVDALRRGHEAGVDAVERLLLSEVERGAEPQNHLLIWPAWRYGAYCGAKLVTVFPGNSGRAGAATNATVYVLFDGRDGRPLAVIEGAEFTLRKTAADSALAATYLARKDADRLLMIGAGAQAPAQIRAFCAVCPGIREVKIWNRSFAKARALAAALARDGIRPDAAGGEAHLSIEATDDLEGAVPQAAIISMATAATSPLLEGVLLSPGTHVDLVGSFTPEMREADDATLRRGSLFVDSRRFTVAATGDLAIPIASGVIRAEDIRADLFELAGGRHPGRTSDTEITVLKNGGGGHLDLMVAIALYERALPEAG